MPSLIFAILLYAQSPLQKAIELTREGHYREARALVDGVPEPVEAREKIAFHRLRAAIASGLHDPKIAMDEMETALALAPQDSVLLLATAAAEMQSEQFELALRHAQAAGPGAKRDALLGDIEERMRDSNAAIRAYRRAVADDPANENYAIALGLELLKQQQFEEASRDLAGAHRAQPKSPKIATLLGVAQYAAGYSDDAVLSLDDAVEADPTLHVAEPALARIVLQTSAALSERTTRNLCSWDPVVCSAIELRAARESGDKNLLAKATEELEHAPDSALRACELARAREWEQRLPEAREELEACVRLDDSPQNHYRLGLLYRRLGEPELANREMARRAELVEALSEQTALARSAMQDPQFKTHH